MKLWYYQPRSASPEIHFSRETILEDMKDDLEWAREEEPDGEGLSWAVSDKSIFVDDGGNAELVDVVGLPEALMNYDLLYRDKESWRLMAEKQREKYDKLKSEYDELRFRMDKLEK